MQDEITRTDGADVADDEKMERELAELTGHLDAAVHRQITLIRRIDESGLWARQGAKTCAHWLSWRVKMDPGTAREKLRVGHALVKLSKVDEAFRTAKLSYSQVRAMTRVATADNEERLLELAECSTASQLERICRGVRQVMRAEGEVAEGDDVLDRWVRYRPMGDGTARVEMQLGADEAYRVMAELRKVRKGMSGGDAKPSLADAVVRLIELFSVGEAAVATSKSGGAGGRAVAEAKSRVASASESADVSAEVCAEAKSDASQESVTERPDVSAEVCAEAESDASQESVSERSGVSTEMCAGARPDASQESVSESADVSAEASAADAPNAAGRRAARPNAGGLSTLVLQLGPDLLEPGYTVTLDDGTLLHSETFRRIACDCGLVPVGSDEQGRTLDVGRKTRRIPPALRRALVLRDRGCCAFPGCTHAVYIHAHHLEHWIEGGETKLENLVSLCSFHHRLVHEGGWTVRLDGDRAMFVRPDGNGQPATFPRNRVELDDALAPLKAAHGEVQIDEYTVLSGWGGEQPDMNMCVEAALPRSVLDAPAAEWLRENAYLS